LELLSNRKQLWSYEVLLFIDQGKVYLWRSEVFTDYQRDRMVEVRVVDGKDFLQKKLVKGLRQLILRQFQKGY
jgi:hypothetical protein